MTWADKAGLAIAASIALIAALLTLVLFVAVGAYDPGRLYTTIALWTGIAEIAIAVPLWVVLRVIGFLFVGRPQRQRTHQTAGFDMRREPAPLETPEAAAQDLPQ